MIIIGVVMFKMFMNKKDRSEKKAQLAAKKNFGSEILKDKKFN